MVSAKLIKGTYNPPEKLDENIIQFIKTEEWEVTKASLLSQRETIETELAEKQKQLDEVNQLLQMFGV